MAPPAKKTKKVGAKANGTASTSKRLQAAAKPKAVKPASKSTSVSQAKSDSSDDDSDSESDDDRAAMLAALEAHGRAMFGLGMPAESSAQAARRAASESGSSDDDEEEDDSEDDGDEFDDGWGADGAFVTGSEDEFTPPTSAAPQRVVPEVVFAPTGMSSAQTYSKADKRAFLSGNSAKMMGLKKEDVAGGRKRARAASEDAEEQFNDRLDKTLHSMLLTTLLPGAASDAASRPVDKRNAIQGRLRELASYALPGEGVDAIKGATMSAHPAKVRTGLVHAQQKRAERARDEAEQAGSWIKGVGGLGDLGKRGAGRRPNETTREVRTFGDTKRKKGMDGKKNERAKGLRMGVGRFENGTLKISEGEIARVNNAGKGRKPKGKGKMRGW